MKYLSSLAVIAACAIGIASCKKDEPTNQSAVEEQILFADGAQIGNGDQEFEIKGTYTIKKGTYSLKGWVYVTNGAELTIEAGTVIKGDKETKAALVVEPGGKLFAKGTATEPIVFTSAEPKGSRKPGDWGGLIICGRAKNNSSTKAMIIEGGPRTLHGGNNDDDNSGIISYVRVEFAGNPFKTDLEINGITFGSVGRGTQIDHVQVSYSNDDSFEWFGGTVSCKYLVAYHGWDDDFDTDYGFSGKLQFLLGIRNPKIADQSRSNGFESDNNADGSFVEPYTECTFSNVTLVGPIGQAADFVNNTEYINGGAYRPNNDSKTGQFQAAMQVRRNSRLNCYNSVAIGYPVGLIIENDKGSTTQKWADEGKLAIKNVYFAKMDAVGSDRNGSLKDILCTDGTVANETANTGIQSFSHAYFEKNNTYIQEISDLGIKQPNSMSDNPNWGPTAGSILLGKAKFDDACVKDGFDKVTYIGAFAGDSDADNWMKGWTNFDPQNTEY